MPTNIVIVSSSFFFTKKNEERRGEKKMGENENDAALSVDLFFFFSV